MAYTRVCYRDLLTVTADQTSPAGASASAVTTGMTGFADFSAITIVATITGGTGGTLDVMIEHSPDGTNWYEYCHLPQLSAGASATTYVYSPALNDQVVQVGKNLTTTTTLAAANGAGGHWFDQLRVRYITGSGNSAGAAQNIKVACVMSVS